MRAGSSEAMRKETVTLAYAVEDFFDVAKNLKGFSNATISSYRADFNQFGKFLDRQKTGLLDVSTITSATIEDFCLELLQEKKLHINSVHRKKDALSSLFRHCKKRGWLDINPVERVDIAPKKKTVRKVLLNEHQTRNFILTSVRVKGYRLETIRAVKLSLCLTGMRNSEIRKLNWEAVDLNENIITVYSSKNTAKKGNPDDIDRQIPICTILKHALVAIQVDDSGPVFRNNRGTRLTKDAMKSIVQRASQSVDTKISITPHGFRHSLASNLEKIGAVQSDLAYLLGHKHNSTTSGYIHSNLDRIAEFIERFSKMVMDEKLNESENMEHRFSINEREDSCTHGKQFEPNCNRSERRDIVLDLHTVIAAERIWNEIHGEKPMPASFLLGYAFRP